MSYTVRRRSSRHTDTCSAAGARTPREEQKLVSKCVLGAGVRVLVPLSIHWCDPDSGLDISVTQDIPPLQPALKSVRESAMKGSTGRVPSRLISELLDSERWLADKSLSTADSSV